MKARFIDAGRIILEPEYELERNLIRPSAEEPIWVPSYSAGIQGISSVIVCIKPKTSKSKEDKKKGMQKARPK